MIVVSGEITIDPADSAAALEAAGAVSAATREEEGCIAYDFWVHPTDSGRFRVFEEWESADALATHFGQPHMATFMEAMGALNIRSSEIHQYEVTDKRPVGT